MGQPPDRPWSSPESDPEDEYWSPGRYVSSSDQPYAEQPDSEQGPDRQDSAQQGAGPEIFGQQGSDQPGSEQQVPGPTGPPRDDMPPPQAPTHGQQPGYGQSPGYGQPPQPPSYGQPPGYGQASQPPSYGQHGYGYQGYGPQSGYHPAYGQPGQWHDLPPEDLLRMHHPGVIPLKRLNLGEIFEGALKTMRRNPEATIGMSVLVLGILLIPSLGISLAIPHFVKNTAVVDQLAIANLVTLLLNSLATLVLSGLVIYVVSEAALGDRVGVGQTWQAVKGRIPALVGISLLSFLIIFGATLGVIAAGVGLTLVLGPIGGILLVLGMFAFIPLVLWLYARFALGPAAVVLEKAGPIAGLKRSWALTTGGQAWRVLGISLLAGILASIFVGVIGGMLGALIGTGVNLAAGDVSNQLTLQLILSQVTSFIVGALSTPFTAGVTALLYLDQRIRREGLDVALVRAAQERAAARRD